jgi:hypothetical protein
MCFFLIFRLLDKPYRLFREGKVMQKRNVSVFIVKIFFLLIPRQVMLMILIINNVYRKPSGKDNILPLS